MVANTPGAIEPILCTLREKVVDGAVRGDPPGAGVLVGAFVRTASEPAAGHAWTWSHDLPVRNESRQSAVMKPLVPSLADLGQ